MNKAIIPLRVNNKNLWLCYMQHPTTGNWSDAFHKAANWRNHQKNTMSGYTLYTLLLWVIVTTPPLHISHCRRTCTDTLIQVKKPKRRRLDGQRKGKDVQTMTKDVSKSDQSSSSTPRVRKFFPKDLGTLYLVTWSEWHTCRAIYYLVPACR